MKTLGACCILLLLKHFEAAEDDLPDRHGPTKYTDAEQPNVGRRLFAPFNGDGIHTTDLDSTTKEKLVEMLTGKHNHHTVSNIQYTGINRASGSFKVVGDNIIGIKEGIVLTSGAACNVQGPNDSSITTHENFLPGDDDLDDQLPSFSFTRDASVLEFDYECHAGKPLIKLEYVFGSEEYNEYVFSTFNDIFGFFVNGVNIALLPDGNPVTIDTVSCVGSAPNCHVFVDNTVAPQVNTELDGFTEVLEAIAPEAADGKYHVKLAIADTSDTSVDSAVFIKSCAFKCGPDPGCNGDPHFTTWGGHKYDYHGACDLILVQNRHFANGLGMDIHVRTKLQGTEGSYIESVAIRIGADVLEVKADQSTVQRSMWLNGIKNTSGDLEGANLSGFPVMYRKEAHKDLTKKRHVYAVQLSAREKIIIKSFKHLLNVHFTDTSVEHFRGSLGLLGSFDSGLRVGRDGETVIDDDIQFGEEWQVLSTEPMLFHNADGPQHPQTCGRVNLVEKHEKVRLRREDYKKRNRRRLTQTGLTQTVSQDEAVAACGGVVDEDSRKDCVFDVMSLGDLDMVEMYMEDDADSSFAH